MSKSLYEVIQDEEAEHGRPQGRIEAWQKDVHPGCYVVFALSNGMAYGEVLDPPEEIPSRYRYLKAYARGVFDEQEMVLPLQTLAYPVDRERFEAARISGFPASPQHVNLFVGFTHGGAA